MKREELGMKKPKDREERMKVILSGLRTTSEISNKRLQINLLNGRKTGKKMKKRSDGVPKTLIGIGKRLKKTQ